MEVFKQVDCTLRRGRMPKTEFVLSENDAGRRLDRVLRKFLTHLPLSLLYAAIRKGAIHINGKRAALHYRTAAGDTLSIAHSLLLAERQQAAALQSRRNKLNGKKTHSMAMETALLRVLTASAIPLLLNATDLLIINKPAGIPVHGNISIETILFGTSPQGYSKSRQMINCPQQSLSFRRGPLHRLDKGTTGVLCFSQTLVGAQWFSHCLQQKTVGKYYIGVVHGMMPAQCIVTSDRQNGKMITNSDLVAYNRTIDASLMLFTLITGKKHQIRKHVLSVGHPLIGDGKYGGGQPLPACQGYLLHAWRLFFPVPRPVDIPDVIEAPLFPEMNTCLDRYFSNWKTRADLLIHQIQAVDNF